GKAQIAVFLDNELAANGHHKEDAQPSSEQRQREDAPEGKFGAKAEEDQCRNRKHDGGRERFTGGAGGMEDDVLTNGGPTERAKDADGEDGDGNGSGDGQAGPQADINGDGAEQESEEGAQDDGTEGELGEGFFGGDIGAKFARRGRGTPGTIGHRILLSGKGQGQIGKKVRGDYAAGSKRGKAVLPCWHA